MKKRLMILLAAVFLIFTCSMTASLLYTKRSKDALEQLITLHRAEHARDELIIALYKAKADYGMPAALRASENIENMASKCNACHHSPDVQARINMLQTLADKFADKIRKTGSSLKAGAAQPAVFYKAEAEGMAALKLAQDMNTAAHNQIQKITRDTMQSIGHGQFLIFVVLGASFFVAVIISRRLIASVISPIARLVQATNEIASGNFGYRLSLAEETEFSVLADHFNKMSSSLAEKQEIEASELKYRTISEFSTDWEYWINEKRELEFVSPSCREVTGYSQEEFISNPRLCTGIIYSPDIKLFNEHHRRFEAAEHVQLEFRIVTKSGDVRWVSHRCRPVYIDGVFRGRRVSNRNITDQHRLEDQLRHAQKMEAIGTFAGGIAHDFNNILTVIIGYGNILHLNMAAEDPLRRHVEQILNAADRAASLTRGLLTYCRSQPLSPRASDLNSILKMSIGMVERLLRADIEIKTKYWPDPLTVLADVHQIEQVIVNLATNARDAMPDGGRISIETFRVELSKDFIELHQLARADYYALMTFSDTGHGMDEKTRQSMFEPFFTTKDIGKGTGLGLSIVYGIVKQHGGAIECYSRPGHGTRFYIYLPIVDAHSDEPQAFEHGQLEKGAETILVAEDDQMIRSLIEMILEEAGYRVISAVDGEDAIDKFRRNKDDVRLCLLDVVMPKKNAKAALEAIRALRTDVKAIFMSGYTGDIFEPKELDMAGTKFISKPIKPVELLKQVREVLAG